MVEGLKKVVIDHWASQPWRVMWPASLETVDEGKEESSQEGGKPGVGAKRAVSSELFSPPSESLS